MPIIPKVAGSGSAQPKLIASVNYPDDTAPPTWHDGKRWVSPANVDGETGEGTLNFTSVANGLPVWDGYYIHTDQGQMPLWRFFELNNIPEADQAYLQAQLDAAYDAAMQMPGASEAYVNCCPLWNDRTVTCKLGSKTLPVRNGALFLRVKHAFRAVAVVVQPVPPSISASVILTDTRHYYFNNISTYAYRPSMRGSNEAGELIDHVDGQWCSPWPEDKHRAVVVGAMKADPAGTALDWTGYIIPTDDDGEAGAKFAGTAATGYPSSPDEARLSELDNILQNVDDAAANDPTHGLLIPAPTVGNPWRCGLYYLGGKLVMARAIEVYGQGVSAGTQVPNSRLLELGGYALERDYWPGGSGVPASHYPNAQLTYPDASGGTRVGTLAASPTALDTYAYFFESVGDSGAEQHPWIEMSCTVESGNGKATSDATHACVAFLTNGTSSGIDITVNGGPPDDEVTIEYSGAACVITVPLSSYWDKSGGNVWASGQTLAITARWRAWGGNLFFVVNAAFNAVPAPSAPTPESIQFDEFRQWDFGSPSQT